MSRRTDGLPKVPTYGDLEDDILSRGWLPDRQSGSHRTFQGPEGRSFPIPVNHRGRDASSRVLSTYRRTVLSAPAVSK